MAEETLYTEQDIKKAISIAIDMAKKGLCYKADDIIYAEEILKLLKN